MEIIVLRAQILRRKKSENHRNIWEAFPYGNISRMITQAEKYIDAKYKPQK